MKQWRCRVCGYIHVGDAPPQVCPVCGVGPEFFDELKETVAVPNEIREEAKQALFEIPCGLFVVTSFSNNATPKYNGMINNTVFQITDQPQQVVLGMDKSHLTTDYIQESQSFVINFLIPSQLSLVKLYGYKSGREVDKFAETPWHPGITGAPILAAAAGYLECSVIPSKTIDAGTHLIFLGLVVGAKAAPDGALLTYQEYRRRKNELRA